jgi:hypothetical protein
MSRFLVRAGLLLAVLGGGLWILRTMTHVPSAIGQLARPLTTLGVITLAGAWILRRTLGASRADGVYSGLVSFAIVVAGSLGLLQLVARLPYLSADGTDLAPAQRLHNRKHHGHRQPAV